MIPLLQTIDKERFSQLLAESNSYRNLAIKLSIPVCGNSHRCLKKFILDSNLSVEHFKHGGHSAKQMPLKDVLVENSTYHNGTLKIRLYREKLLEPVCQICQQTEVWNDKPLCLQLDHINGNHYDNRIENLRILCPNCHTQTDTFGSRRKRILHYCEKCGLALSNNNKFCQECYVAFNQTKHNTCAPKNRVLNLTKEELETLVWEIPTEQIGKRFGVSGKAVEHRCKRLGVTKPTRGYWNKKK
jgi:hypothetical protein